LYCQELYILKYEQESWKEREREKKERKREERKKDNERIGSRDYTRSSELR
jgi:hypothetical protein